MKILQVIMSVISLSFGIITVAAQHQILDVCIRVKSDKYFRREQVDVSDLIKFKQFGTGKPRPFENYLRVRSAVCYDALGTGGCVEVQKNLVKSIPYMIEKDLDKSGEKNQRELAERYKFPKHVSQSFIDHVKNSVQPVMHTVYTNDKNSLILRYTIELLKAKKSTEPTVNRTLAVSKSHGGSFIDGSYIVGFGFFALTLLAMTNN